MSRSTARDAKVVLAARSDGLGERLNALLVAMALAERLGVPFRFAWPQVLVDDRDHAIVPSAEFFSAEFVTAHEIDVGESVDGFAAVERTDDLAALTSRLAASDRGLRVRNRKPPALSRHEITAQFARIGFAPEIDSALAAAHDLTLDDRPVGIQIRAGDIVFGRSRAIAAAARKAIPAPLARAAIDRFHQQGRPVIVFGQDPALIAGICADTGAMDAAARRPPGLSVPAQAMFDVALLSRCDPIVGGWSGFAILAASITGGQAVKHTDMFDAAEVIQMTRADLARHGDEYHPAHRAHAWWWAYHVARDRLDVDEADELLHASIVADPTNPRPRLRLAALCYRHGRPDRGDDVLVDGLVGDVDSGLATFPSAMMLRHREGGGYDAGDVFDDIERAADGRPGPASLLRAALRAVRAEPAGARADLAAFMMFAAADPRLAGLDRVAAMSEATIEQLSTPNGDPEGPDLAPVATTTARVRNREAHGPEPRLT